MFTHKHPATKWKNYIGFRKIRLKHRTGGAFFFSPIFFYMLSWVERFRLSKNTPFDTSIIQKQSIKRTKMTTIKSKVCN